jgi:hypothetical protein
MSPAVKTKAAKRQFPLMAWNTETPSDLKLLQRARACGLTLAGIGDAKGLANCHQSGLTLIVQDPVFSHDWSAVTRDWRTFDPAPVRAAVQKRIRQLMRKPGLGGYYLMDEPGAALFPGLARMAELIREIDPHHWIYINLLPNYASPEQLGTPTYADYLEAFVKHCRPQALSYDNYFLTRENPADHNLFWSNLQEVAECARRHALPFWNIVNSVGSYSYRVPTDADLKLQAFGSLAYGAGGIAYFTYFAPPHGNYRLSPVDQFNQETPTWYHLQNLNLQIQNLAPVLLDLNWLRAYHLGTVPPGCQGRPDAGFVQNSPMGPLVVGDFEMPDKTPYLLMVNPDLERSIFVRLELRADLEVAAIVSAYTGTETPFHDHQAFLAPGQGALLRLKTKAKRLL